MPAWTASKIPWASTASNSSSSARPKKASSSRCSRCWASRRVAEHRSKDVDLWRQNDVNFVVNYEPGSLAAYFAEEHGPSACGMAFRVRTRHKAYERALDRSGAQPMDIPTGPMELRLPAIRGIGGAPLYLIDRYADGSSIYDIDFRWLDDVAAARRRGLPHIDHLTHNVYRGRMDWWARFYERLFGFREIRHFDIKGRIDRPHLARHDRARRQDPHPAQRGSRWRQGQIEEFLMAYNGEGIQHIAFATDDLIAVWDRLKAARRAVHDGAAGHLLRDARGASARPRRGRRGLQGARHPARRRHTPRRHTEAAAADLLETKSSGPIFFEFIQRKRDEGFGEGNFKALFESDGARPDAPRRA
jgi:4-hydroxyphenylpyruvate dioxygenase